MLSSTAILQIKLTGTFMFYLLAFAIEGGINFYLYLAANQALLEFVFEDKTTDLIFLGFDLKSSDENFFFFHGFGYIINKFNLIQNNNLLVNL
jgi:hypothetical protein